MNEKLDQAWKAMLAMRAEADEMRKTADAKMEEINRLTTERVDMIDQSRQRQRDARALWDNAVAEVHGAGVKAEWLPRPGLSYACKLPNGDVYEPDPVA